MFEGYYNNPTIVREALDVLHATPPAGDAATISLSEAAQEIIRQEAFYCRATEAEMPSRAVLHGASVLSLAEGGAYLSFGITDPLSGGRRLPFLHPLPTDREAAKEARLLPAPEAGASVIELSLEASGILAVQSEKNGLSMEDNFAALVKLINYIGTSERVGLALLVDTNPN